YYLIAFFFFFTHPPTTVIYTLSLHDALPIFHVCLLPSEIGYDVPVTVPAGTFACTSDRSAQDEPASLVLQWHTCFVPRCHSMFPDRKSTRLNSSHLVISYAVFCLKKKR